MRNSLKRYAAKIQSGKKSALHPKSLAYKLPKKVVLITKDTETTGLDYNRGDEIHELAAQAADEKFSILASFHAKSKIKIENDPGYNITNYVMPYLLRVFEKNEDARRFASKCVKRFALVKGLKSQGKLIRGIENSYSEAIYNILSEYQTEREISPGNSDLYHIYRGIKSLSRAYDIHWVLKLTNYDHDDPERLENEAKLAKSFLTFIRHTMETNAGRNKLFIVGQNVGFDLKMFMQSLMHAGVSYGIYSQFEKFDFIDTAMVMRKYINKYLLCTFMYYHKKWVASSPSKVADRDPKLEKVLIALEPVYENRLGFLTDYFGIENNAWHTADNDIKATQELLLIQLAIDLRFWEKCDRDPELLAILHEVEQMKTKSVKINQKDRKVFQSIVAEFGQKPMSEVNDFIDEINDRSPRSETGKKKAFAEQQFMHQTVDPFRTKHKELFNNFLRSIGENKEDYKVNQKDKKESESKYETLIKHDFPGATDKIVLTSEWWEKSFY